MVDSTCEFCKFSTSPQVDGGLDDVMMTTVHVESRMSTLLVSGLSELAARVVDVPVLQHEENNKYLEKDLRTTRNEIGIAKIYFAHSEKQNAVLKKRLELEKSKKLRQQQNVMDQKAEIVDLQQEIEEKRFCKTAVQYSIIFALMFVTLVHCWKFSLNYLLLGNASLHQL